MLLLGDVYVCVCGGGGGGGGAYFWRYNLANTVQRYGCVHFSYFK